ncbi:MAG TPA: methyltransferase domain-containing protein [Streptosporangiales bacterium]
MPGFVVHLPEVDEGLSQDQEYCLLVEDGRERRIRFHDYGEIYSVRGLYEKLFADLLKCSSPEMIATLLTEEVERAGESVADLHVLDLGAGNGMVGEQLRARGVERLVAVDIIEEAADAARRDRPDVYERYHVGDISDLPEDAANDLAARDITCLTCVAALGFGDIPPAAFLAAYDLVPSGGWVAFNIKDTFLDKATGSAFAALIREMIGDGRLRVCTQRTYTHRLSVSGDKLPYVAIVARKP